MANDPWRSFGPALATAAQERVRKTPGKITQYLEKFERNGYNPAFIPGVSLPLPGLGTWQADAAEVDPVALGDGQVDPHELRYRNFSVKVSMSRRMPIYSVVNIDGSLSKRSVPRTDIWKYDPRIETQYQLLDGIYGNEAQGLFSRGHMTRREDPNWGEDLTIIKQADADTFHATNAAPQRQGFNGGVWLALEKYILDNTDQEDIRATVLTGPVFGKNDPVYQGVQVPTEFWKIVAYVNPVLNAPTAIAYKRSQASYLPKRAGFSGRFVFGDFQDTQVSVASLAGETGLDLSGYEELDVFRNTARGLTVRLRSVEDAFLSP